MNGIAVADRIGRRVIGDALCVTSLGFTSLPGAFLRSLDGADLRRRASKCSLS